MTLKEVIVKIKKIAETNEIEPYQVTTSQLGTGGLSERQLRKYGGLPAIKKANFPFVEKDLGVISSLKKESNYISKLEKRVGELSNFNDEITKIIKGLKPLPVGKKLYKPTLKKEKSREVVLMLNDCHVGLVVDPDEVGGLNKFDYLEAGRRFALMVRETIEYKLHARKEVTKLHLILNGDLMAGLIHGTATKSIDLWINQMNGCTHILTHVIQSLVPHFPQIEITCLGGNHEEMLHKREGGRVTSEHFDNYSNSVFYALSVAFRNDKSVKFNIPKTPYAFVQMIGGRALIAHGHNIFSKSLGNPGTSINVKALSDAIRSFNSGELAQGREPVKLVLFGHTHTYCHFVTSEGVEVYVAPSLSGTDGFAHQLNINHNFIGQVVFESTKDYIMGDSRLVRLNEADKDKSLDKIIPPYSRDLKWKL